jgi:hypothetical protein
LTLALNYFLSPEKRISTFPASLENPVSGLAGRAAEKEEAVAGDSFSWVGEKARLRASVTFQNKISGPF